MSEVLLWSWLFTIPGLFMTGFKIGRPPGVASVAGPLVMFIVAAAAFFGGAPAAEVAKTGWLPFLPNGTFLLRADQLSALMLVVVGGISTCVYVYSLAYMDTDSDAGRRRFFMFLDFFVASMGLLVLAGNLAVLLVGWSGVGLSSYLVIAFWFDRPGRLSAGLQALSANAVGDAALLLLVVLLPTGCGDLVTLQSATCTAVPGGAMTIGVLLLIAACAKSAQGPLYFWLPSAMAGPTPISALIHAATMVAAGVYLLVRTSAVLTLAPGVLQATAIIGVLTALGGGIAGLFQSNLKRGLAYSTVSQLGYMFAAVGLGAPFAAMFHLTTHAAFKALLFLTSGVVIHALDGEEELTGMGGLRKTLPSACIAFLIGSLALIGIPLFSGAFSKDTILEAAQANDNTQLLFIGLFIAVFLTGLYIGRLFFMTFYGPRRYHHDIHAPSGLMLWPLVPLAIGSLFLGYLEWPVPVLSNLLTATIGHIEPSQFPTPLSAYAGLLGLAGFVLAAWRGREVLPAHKETPLDIYESRGWVGLLAEWSYGIAGLFAGVQAGRLGQYLLMTVIGIGIIILLTFIGASVDVSAALTQGLRS
ncbi:MAG: NADH-quinone oxidoreductase subunit L [Chloroflexi bacterium]|nr:NADH-quinone oxidoreductase subunit L [Chloroflexota bacterium]